jgi:hypothetical protein
VNNAEWAAGFEENLDMGVCATASQHQAPPPEYYEWIAKLKKLAASQSTNFWDIGDLLNEGQDHFDIQNIIGTLPGYMRISHERGPDGECHSIKLPNFWKDVSSETGIPTQQLKTVSRVAYAYKKEERFDEFSFSHHGIIASFDKRLEYLAECKREWERRREDCPDAKKPSTAWLMQYAERMEGRSETEVGDKCVSFAVSPEKWNKLRDIGKYYQTRVGDLIGRRCNAVIDEYLEQMAEKISLERFGLYEGEWPFTKKRITQRERKERRAARRSHDPERRAKAKRAAVNFRTMRRNELVVA